MPFESLSEQQFIKKLTEITEANLSDENFGVSQLAKELGMSRVTLHRKIKSIIKKSVSTFIRETRLKRSLELLQKKAGTVSEIAYSVGFGSPPYFTKCFRDYYGYSPGEVLKSDFTLNEQKQIDKGKRKYKYLKIVAGLFIIIVAGLTTLFVIQINSEKYQENSLAVLPFQDNSPEGELRIISGIRQEIQNKLENIAGLNIVSRTFTEKYRKREMDIKDIAREINARYIIDGRGETINGKTKIWIGLIDVKSGDEVWSEHYTEIVDKETIWDVYEDLAESVASELQISISSDEKTNIALMETENKLAYNYYLQGVAMMDVVVNRFDIDDIYYAKKMFELAVKEDSTFSAAYTALAVIYSSKLGPEDSFPFHLQSSYMDSSLMMAEKALLYNPDDARAWGTKAIYYRFKGMSEESEKYHQIYLDRIIRKNYGFYVGEFHRYHGMRKHYKAIEAYYKYLELIPPMLKKTPSTYFVIDDMAYLGFDKLAGSLNRELRFGYNNDSLNYFLHQTIIEHFAGNFEEAHQNILQAFFINPEENLCFSFAILNSIFKEDYADGLNYALKWEETVKKNSGIDFWNHMEAGFIYLKNGMHEKAEKHLTGKMYGNLNSIKQNRPSAQLYESHFNLACIYAAQYDTANAKIYIKQIGNANTNYAWLYKMMKYHTMLENVRETPEFKKTFAFLEEKYREEYENTRRLLKRKGAID